MMDTKLTTKVLQKKIAERTDLLLQLANETTSLLEHYKLEELYIFRLQASVVNKRLSSLCKDVEEARDALIEKKDPAATVSIQLANQTILLASQKIELLTQLLAHSRECQSLSNAASQLENQSAVEQLKKILLKGKIKK